MLFSSDRFLARLAFGSSDTALSGGFLVRLHVALVPTIGNAPMTK